MNLGTCWSGKLGYSGSFGAGGFFVAQLARPTNINMHQRHRHINVPPGFIGPNGRWSLVIGQLAFVIGHWSLVICHWSLAVDHLEVPDLVILYANDK
jgi:hypothetical protein